jgi:DNA polymerase-3 subunit alpha (Gram-positive type)
MMRITEVNPLAPHYYCPDCHFSAFKFTDVEKEKYGLSKEQQSLDEILQAAGSGYDLPNANCPCCGRPLKKDGQDIPFETFLGFSGDKIPDIDLNFSGKYQARAHEYVRTLMGDEHAFRAGTVTTVAENTAFGYVKAYLERKGITKRQTEITRIAKQIEGVRRSTGQHPGGIVVVPRCKEIYDVTPIQYPADKIDNTWRTTHFDYHQFEENLLKLDILGHDDPTTLRFIFDYVEAHPEEFPFTTPQGIPVDDPMIYKMFNETEVLGLKPTDINCEVATFAIPEFGTRFTRQMLIDTKPKNFSDLVKISGLSHGTDVWATNTQDLVLGVTEFGKIPFSEVIGCRDDIMVYLIENGLEPKMAFDIMEYVRKGKAAKGENPAKWAKYVEAMKEKNIPEWYYWSCERIKYMFPKAHAVAYVLMAVRIAWFKVYKPILFYSAFFSIRASQFEPDIMMAGVSRINSRINEINAMPKTTVKDEDLLTMYQVATEMLKRGFKFLPVDINKSHSTDFVIEGDNLRLPLISIPGLGEGVAIDAVERRNEKKFTSIEDVTTRTKINKTVIEKMILLNAFPGLKEEEDITEIGLFAF